MMKTRIEDIPEGALELALDIYYDAMPVKGPDELRDLVYDIILAAVGWMEDNE